MRVRRRMRVQRPARYSTAAARISCCCGRVRSRPCRLHPRSVPHRSSIHRGSASPPKRPAGCRSSSDSPGPPLRRVVGRSPPPLAARSAAALRCPGRFARPDKCRSLRSARCDPWPVAATHWPVAARWREAASSQHRHVICPHRYKSIGRGSRCERFAMRRAIARCMTAGGSGSCRTGSCSCCCCSH